ncbi:vinorine synthase [Phtheirospermum japonicum]|uniref:Vinorine synthase n=1 Tax=Phtheirospermum japonicum TaxID=374723 RepID=A0A830AZ03_9LAMI|nr:vinorine synthase [Phtheirospermum japonicum]
MLDQIVPPMLVPLVLYFPNPNKISDPNHHSNNLKHSLSVTLTRFYPLAGRVNPDGQSINCHDQGVPFTVVKSRLNLSDLLRNKPDENLPRHLLPCAVTWDTEHCPGSSVALVQVNYFDCGDIAIGLVFWHKIADALTMGNFVNAWAHAARGSSESIPPSYVAQSVFPPKSEMQNPKGSLSTILKTGESIMRRYTFDAPAISKLKSIMTSAAGNRRGPTRVEAVSALIWRCFMAASRANHRSASVMTHAVNLRRRAEPPFPAECFGNFPGLAAAAAYNGEIENEGFELGQLLGKMRAAIAKIDGEFVKRLQGDDGMSGYLENLRLTWRDIPENADLLSISSWCGFGLYGVDFGFGKPAWLTRCDSGCDAGSRFLNVVWLMDARDGVGIEAWVILEEKYMSVFENVDDLRVFASCDPSPLDNIDQEPIRFASHCGTASVEEGLTSQLNPAFLC